MSAVLLGLTVLLLVANGFFVAVEFALVASRRTKLEPLAEQGGLRARFALRASGELSLQLAGAQLGITMSSLALGAIAEPAIADLIERAVETVAEVPAAALHALSFTIALTIVVFLHMVVGEMAPKTIAIAAPEQTLLCLAVPNRVYVWLFGPVIRILNAVANAGVRAVGVEPRDDLARAHTAEDLSVMLAASREEGLIEELAHDLLSGAFDFGDRPVRGVLVPWDRVVSVARHATVAEAEQLVVASGHSRLPVVGPGSGEVVGFVHAKDLLTVSPDARDRAIPLGRIRRMLLVSENRPLDEVLVSMRRARTHLAAVVGRDGRPLGIASLEDVVEELVGDIRDETDEPAVGAPGPRRAPGGSGSRRSSPVR